MTNSDPLYVDSAHTGDVETNFKNIFLMYFNQYYKQSIYLEL